MALLLLPVILYVMKRKTLLLDLVCALFILLFLYTALSKLYDFETLRVQLGRSPLLTDISELVAWAVPAIEIVLAGILMVPRTRDIGLYGSFTLMVMFTAYIFAILNFSDVIPCSCGGVISKLSWSGHLVLNIFFTFLAAAGILMYPVPLNTQLSTALNLNES